MQADRVVKKVRRQASFFDEKRALPTRLRLAGGKTRKGSLAQQACQTLRTRRRVRIGRQRPRTALRWFAEKVPRHKA